MHAAVETTPHASAALGAPLENAAEPLRLGLRERLLRAATELERFLTAWSVTAPGMELPHAGLGGGRR